MPYKLISLVFLLYFLIISKAYTEDEFIFPVKKPSVFKNTQKKITNFKKESQLPQKKPILKETTEKIETPKPKEKKL